MYATLQCFPDRPPLAAVTGELDRPPLAAVTGELPEQQTEADLIRGDCPFMHIHDTPRNPCLS